MFSKLHMHLFQSVEKLHLESKKVFQALGYLQGVVDKGILEMLPGSSTIVLETVMELSQLLGNYFVDQDRWCSCDSITYTL